MWGALSGVLGHAATAAPAPVSSSGGLNQLLSTAGMLGVAGHAALGFSAAPAASAGVSAAHSHLMGALGGGFGMGYSASLPVQPVAAATAPQTPAASSGSGITAAEQEVIDALRAQAQLRSTPEQTRPAMSAHTLAPSHQVSSHLLMSAPQQAVLWPQSTAWGGVSAATSAPTHVTAAPAAEAPPAPPPADEVNPTASISPQHMELLVALLNGQDVRSHPGYQSLRQVLLGNQQPTYEDLLRQRWSGQ